VPQLQGPQFSNVALTKHKILVPGSLVAENWLEASLVHLGRCPAGVHWDTDGIKLKESLARLACYVMWLGPSGASREWQLSVFCFCLAEIWSSSLDGTWSGPGRQTRTLVSCESVARLAALED
jgi:hypothetical protein